MSTATQCHHQQRLKLHGGKTSSTVLDKQVDVKLGGIVGIARVQECQMERRPPVIVMDMNVRMDLGKTKSSSSLESEKASEHDEGHRFRQEVLDDRAMVVRNRRHQRRHSVLCK